MGNRVPHETVALKQLRLVMECRRELSGFQRSCAARPRPECSRPDKPNAKLLHKPVITVDSVCDDTIRARDHSCACTTSFPGPSALQSG